MGTQRLSMEQLPALENPVRLPKGPRRPPTEEEIRRRVEALEAKFTKPQVDSAEKIRVQGELSFMRKELAKGTTRLAVTYPVNPPFSFVQVWFNTEAGEFQYDVKEPTMRPGEEELVRRIREKIESCIDQQEMPVADFGRFGSSPELQRYLWEKYDYVVDLYDIEVPSDRRRIVFYYLQRDLVGLGRTDAVLRDPFVEDVSCNGPRVPVYVFHRVVGSIRTNVAFPDAAELNRYILKLAQTSGKHVSIYQPILDATLSDGSRVNLTLGTEVTKKGSTFSIRKFSQDPISPIDLIRFGSVSAAQFAFLWHLIENKRSVLVSGGTASGKTTLLNALSMFIRPEDKVVSIEDTAEVHLAHSNWIQSVSRAGYGIAGGKNGQQAGSVSLFDLLVAALRQRPEYILLGEVRGREAFSLFQAISTGHAAMATIHAASMEELLHRIENEPMNIPRVLVEALDAVVFPAQVMRDGARMRRLRLVSEVLEVDSASGNLLTNEVFQWEPRSDTFPFLGRSFVLERIAAAGGRTIEETESEVQRKERFLAALVQSEKSHFRDVTRAVAAYYVDPAEACARYDVRGAGGREGR
jgi:archaeal flagellar protein FlaI